MSKRNNQTQTAPEDISKWIRTLVTDHRDQLQVAIGTLPPKEQLSVILKLLPYSQPPQEEEEKSEAPRVKDIDWSEYEYGYEGEGNFYECDGIWITNISPSFDWMNAVLTLKMINRKTGWKDEEVLKALKDLDGVDKELTEYDFCGIGKREDHAPTIRKKTKDSKTLPQFGRVGQDPTEL